MKHNSRNYRSILAAVDVAADAGAPGELPRALPDDGPRFKLEMLNMAEVEERNVPWLWEPYIPRGEIITIQGAPGQGKSTLAIALAAAITRGGFMPHESGDGYVPVPEGCVFWISNEDHPEYVLARRLRLHEADASRFHVIQGKVAVVDGKRVRAPVSLQDVELLREAVLKYRPALLVLDPLQAYIPAGKSLNAAEDTRPLLDALTDTVRLVDASGIVIRHVSKGQMRSLLDTGMGSGDISGACRSVLAVGSRTDESDADRGMLHVKSNVGPEGRALGYRIVDDGELEWTGPSTIARADLMGRGRRAEGPKAADRAAAFLEEVLADGPRRSGDVNDAAREHGISEKAQADARKALGCIAKKVGRDWWTYLPPEPEDWLKVVGREIG